MDQFEEGDVKGYKIIIIGNVMVGKSALLVRYVDGQYRLNKSTIGVDYRSKKITHKELWDSAGHERYRTIVYNYFKLSKAGVIVFDLTNKDSLYDARNWLQQLANHCGNEIPKILLGNKSDLLSPQELQEKLSKYKKVIQQMKQEFNCEFFVVSAKTGQNVGEAFRYLVGQFYDQKDQMTQPSEFNSFVFKLNSSLVGQNRSQCGSRSKKKCC